PSMGPTIGELDTRTDAAGRDQPIVAGITVDLQNAAKALQYPFGMKATPGGAVPFQGRSSRAKAQKYPVLVFRAPGSSTGARVSSMNSFDDRFRSAIRAS